MDAATTDPRRNSSAMTPTEIQSMIAGPELDRAVHLHVFQAKGKAPAYSTDRQYAVGILDKLPLYVASINPGRDDFNPGKPWKAGTLQYEPSVKGDITVTQFSAPTAEIALCKAALLAVAQAGGAIKRQPSQPRTPNRGASMAERIDGQVKAKRAAKLRPAALPARVNQPGVPRSNRQQLEPMPQRKNAVPGVGQPIPGPGGRMQ